MMFFIIQMSGEGRNLYKSIYHVVRSFLAGGLFAKWVAKKIMFHARKPEIDRIFCSSGREGVPFESTHRYRDIKASALKSLVLVTWGIKAYEDWYENCDDHKFYVSVTSFKSFKEWTLNIDDGSEEESDS